MRRLPELMRFVARAGLLFCAFFLATSGDEVLAQPKTLTPQQQEQLRAASDMLKQAEQLRLEWKYQEALEPMLKALEIQKRVLGENHPDYAGSLHNLANLYKHQAECAKAEPLYRQALEITKRVLGDNHPDYAISLLNLASLYCSQRDYAKAEPLYRQASEIFKRVLGENHPYYATSLNALAVLYNLQGEYAKAEPLQRQALEIKKRVLGENHPDYAASLENLAILYKHQGEYAKAEPLYRQALEITKRMLGDNHPDYAGSLHNLAILYKEQGEYAKAELLYRQALEIKKRVLGENHPDYAISLNNLASLYKQHGEYAKAEPLAREHLRLEIAFVARTIAFLPEASAMAFPRKQRGCDRLLGVLRKMPAASGADAYGSVWRSRGLVSRSLAQRRRAIASTPKAKEVLRELQSTAQQLAQLTLSVPKPEQRAARQKRLAELNEKKERLEEELGRVSSEFDRSREVAEAKPEDLARLLPKGTAMVEFYRAMVWNPPPGGKGKWLEEAHYDAFLLRLGDGPASTKVAWVQLGPAKPIDDAATAWRAAITGRPQPDSPHPNPLPKGEGTQSLPRPRAGEGGGEGTLVPERFLREKLWDKIEPHLAGCSTLVIIPDSSLCFLPWPALPGRKPGTCLLEDYALATAPSGHQLYAALTEPQSAGGKLLLAGGVNYDAQPSALPDAAGLLAARGVPAREITRGPAMTTKSPWVALPGTEREIEDVEKLWPGKPAPTVLRGSAAGEESLRQLLPGSRYVHLATHGFFADEKFRSMFGHDVKGEQLFGGEEMITAKRAQVTARNPLILSGIVLAGANLPPKTDSLGIPTGEDGILTAEEIVNLDLRGTELVVLSACETGLGSVAGGEGVMGLTRAFHLAGARNVIASLWKVDDQATAALMKLLYHKLWKEQKPAMVALREAQLAIYHNPEQIGQLAGTRGPDFAKTVKLVEGGKTTPASKTAPPKLWAGFLLSGPGM